MRAPPPCLPSGSGASQRPARRRSSPPFAATAGGAAGAAAAGASAAAAGAAAAASGAVSGDCDVVSAMYYFAQETRGRLPHIGFFTGGRNGAKPKKIGAMVIRVTGGIIPAVLVALLPAAGQAASLAAPIPTLVESGDGVSASASASVALCSSDDALIAAHFGANASARELRQQLGRTGAPAAGLDATRATLARDLAAALRALSTVPEGNRLDNATALRMALESKAEQYAPSESTATLLERLEQRLEKECFVVNPKRPLAMSLALEDLQSAAAERMLTASGSRVELLGRLYAFQRRCDQMVELIPGFACTLGRIEDALGARGLSKLGAKEDLMARLVEAVDAGKQAAAAAGGMCDVVTTGPVCVAGGKKVLTADAAPRSLLSHLTFDDAHGLDTSGLHNHATKAPTFGPGVGGHGHSARYVGTDFSEVPHIAAFAEAGSAFTVEMWLYLRQDSTGDWRTLMHKGGRDEERTPTLFLEPLTRGIELFVSTTDGDQPLGERLWSNSFVPLHRWTHLAAVAEGHSLRLYLNGLLDSENVTVGTIVHNSGPFFLGGDPWRPAGGLDGFIDEFKFYGRALTTDEIQAAAGFALGGVEPAFIELGCMGCALDAAAATCAVGYHLCNTHDLHAGGYMVARSMGWATSNSHIWTAEEASAGAAPTPRGRAVRRARSRWASASAAPTMSRAAGPRRDGRTKDERNRRSGDM